MIHEGHEDHEGGWTRLLAIGYRRLGGNTNNCSDSREPSA